MIYGSVFSRIEAATVAWHRLGWRPAFFSEIDPFCCALLAHHYPGVENLGDINRHEDWPDATVDLCDVNEELKDRFFGATEEDEGGPLDVGRQRQASNQAVRLRFKRFRS